jgi:hypothetical protein
VSFDPANEDERWALLAGVCFCTEGHDADCKAEALRVYIGKVEQALRTRGTALSAVMREVRNFEGESTLSPEVDCLVEGALFGAKAIVHDDE